MSMKPNQWIKFKLSKPWGYYPPDVDKTIDQYEATLGKLNQTLAEQVQLSMRLKERIKTLEDELRAMHIEMSSIELPDADELAESVVLQDFRNYPNGNAGPVSSDGPHHHDSGGIVQIQVGEDDKELADTTQSMYEEDDETESSHAKELPKKLQFKIEHNDDGFHIVT